LRFAKNTFSRFFERLLLITGLTLLAFVAAVLIYRSVASRRALAEFDRDQASLIQGGPQAGALKQIDEKVDVSLWSEKRIRQYHESLVTKKEGPIAVVKIEKLNIRVPVFEGTDELVLNRGVGWIAGTARPGAPGDGNVGLAAHRDGFFRGLKDIEEGDEIELSTLGAGGVYAVDNIEIVTPDKVEVLRPRGAPSLTLVTCYPFYFVGDAPQRYIVHATLKRQVEVKKFEDRSAQVRTAQFAR